MIKVKISELPLVAYQYINLNKEVLNPIAIIPVVKMESQSSKNINFDNLQNIPDAIAGFLFTALCVCVAYYINNRDKKN